jgi:two-component system LytT family response regulator
MIKAILIDDEVHCLDTLNILLSDYCTDVQVLEQCTSAKKGLTAIDKLNPQLVFLDIEMPMMNGFELLEQFNEIPFAVIFTTSYDQYAIKAIRFSALDYLLKPIDPKELIIAVKKIQMQKILPSAEQFEMLLKQMNHKENGFHKIAIPTAEGFELIPAHQIIRCEADDNYTHLFTKNKNKITVVKYVRGEGGYLVMSDGSIVNVSRSRKDSLMKLF